MLFNSIEYLIFVPVVFILYWFVINKNLFLQNLLILFVSYVFYGWWDWRFLFLILANSIVNYYTGLHLNNISNNKIRKLVFILNVIFNLGLLGFFKYFNFFTDSLISLFQNFGINPGERTLTILLPVGISFFTFQTMSYTIDVYRKKLAPTRDPVAFFAFISFFPQLVAGPIERATNLLPQFYVHRIFDSIKAKDGIRQIVWGLFKKVVIADNCGKVVDRIFANYSDYSGSDLFLGVVTFTVQIYADFSAYSDIAIGTARLFGFSLMQNFAYPNFSRDPGEYWRRWHISLSTWFRDYLYIPLGGKMGSKWIRIRNIIVTFTVSGLWHGANWTFVLWGFINGLYYIPLILFDKVTKYKEVIAHNRFLPTFKEFFQMIITFFLITLTRVFFRSPSLRDAAGYFQIMFSKSLFTLPAVGKSIIPLMFVFLLFEWTQREKKHPLENLTLLKRRYRWAIYYFLIFFILFFSENKQSFIYFQF